MKQNIEKFIVFLMVIICGLLFGYVGYCMYQNRNVLSFEIGRTYCPGCKNPITLRQDMVKQCPTCGYQFHLSASDLIESSDSIQ